ncbi:hypothetical protein [Streptomyces sp. SID9727]|uniref:hypothetical protein n=1 Tax=Streptomyces sp. SID9727 TaxID=2706114 RepID=UPI0013CAFDFB|nr:hypothetical protein [Streptomyces sp. SID9727]NEC63726.1 hypothetical protein [Streptomyces sp. SID9727]
MTGRPLPVLAGTAAALVLAAASMLTGASSATSDESGDYGRSAGTTFADAPKAGVYVNGALPAGTAP